ncbi:hypothetical protein EDF24_3376 [Curtobacterium sp. PhB130]|uniref:DUF6891 domain-containing protein n=1 Tax=Curtobacterium sp. PhB130 TaxID=2485178 RepID=UPI000F4CA3E3|nr:hypothetical protein [Curtobacterium sp. PhB130]ROS73265.1 hypothetical protein EDF24_3376 [Curtobacterium sp. PhB130]
MGFFDRWRRPKGVDDGVDQTGYDILDEVEPDDQMVAEAVTERVLPGFLRFDDVVEAVVEWYADDVPDEAEFRAIVVARARPIWDARRREEASWTWGSSQHDELELAFRRLERLGFVTGMDLGVDQGDGFLEARDLRTPDEDAPGGFREWAYAYFHTQDAEGLCLDRHVLRLAFGSFRPAPDIDPDLVATAMRSSRGEATINERSQLSAGQQVADVLTDRGFELDWDGTAGKRIGIVIEQWRKALPFSDLDEARRVVADEHLRVLWPGERGTSDAAALEEHDGRWHVWATDEKGGPWSNGSWHDDLGAALDRFVQIARINARYAGR